MTEAQRKIIHDAGNDKQTIILLLNVLQEWAEGKNPLTITHKLIDTARNKNLLEG